uniref:Uncharacterized protein n=1 Tax=Accipiter nisus TaxID=211598 RepID=A0A8B9NC44_9AVES
MAARRRRPLSFLCLLFLAFLHPPPPAACRCRRSHGKTCSVPAVPGTEPLGRGLDVTTLEPAGGQVLVIDDDDDDDDAASGSKVTCVLCPDPLDGGRPRRLPAGVGAWRAGRRCRQETRLAEGSRAAGAVAGGTEEVARGWRVGLGGAVAPGARGTVAVAGSHSRAAEFGLRRQREDRYAFASLELRCLHYWWVLPPTPPPPPPPLGRF